MTMAGIALHAIVALVVYAGDGATSAVARQAVDYEREVKPILREHCSACHGALKQNNGLRVDTGEALRKGGESGAAVVPGKPDQSLLWKVVAGRAEFTMPPEGEGVKLAPAKVELLARWIAEGAVVPPDEQPDQDPRQYWSYQQVKRPEVPLADGIPTDSPIDAFLSIELTRRGLIARPPAEKATALRRVTLDLTGLPPDRDLLLEFLADDSPDVYQRAVDQLLASPAHGQRWGRHWMDIWRYSDWYGSRGINEIRYSQRQIWRWRDWVVNSLNAGRGYDRMLREMLAGDELAPGDPDTVCATGFLGRNWYKFDRNVWMFETIEQTAQAFLATTMKCARCHDHKFDPIAQRDYYRFRAFFEPHDVRTDPLGPDLATEKDATLGAVLKTGVDLVFDKQPDVKTFLFKRGDNRYPDESQPLDPGVPGIFGLEIRSIQPIELPLQAWYPMLAPRIVAGLERDAEAVIIQAETELLARGQELTRRQEELDRFTMRESASPPDEAARMGAVFRETFDRFDQQVWRTISGQWEHEPGKLAQKVPGSFSTIVAEVTPPRNFVARLRYRTLEAGSIHSVGLFFDMNDTRAAQAVYTATNDSTVQAFHRQDGAEVYPSAGIVPWPVKIGQEITLDIAVREQQLNVWVNGEIAIAYTMPMRRQDGKFALWTHEGSAEFLELLIDPMPLDFQVAQSTNQKIRSPYVPETQAVARAQTERVLADFAVRIARAERDALTARIAAERQRAEQEDTASAANAARAERSLAVLKAERDGYRAEREHEAVVAASYADDETRTKAVTASQAKLDTSKKTLAEAQSAAQASTDTKYTPLGPAFPRHSTGRRLALANWITDPLHPRTARVAVNQIWLRHFGEAIVPTVANFGMNGQRPSHPELLDWLADRFTASGWDMKRLHRDIVGSAAYGRESTDGPNADQNYSIDPRNRFLWRMNSRRMESEVVRDSVLAIGGRLDRQFGGPEIAESLGEQSTRRSLYFRSTPNEKMPFLEVFDQANPNECYRRQESVMPQQALALTNSLLSLSQAESISESILREMRSSGRSAKIGDVIETAFALILARPPKAAEFEACRKMLVRHRPNDADEVPRDALRSLTHVLLNHNDFVTIR